MPGLGGALPGGLGGQGDARCGEENDEDFGKTGWGERAGGLGHVVPPGWAPGGTCRVESECLSDLGWIKA